MKKAIMKGFSFGLTSAIITTLGIMVGMYSLVASKLYVMGAILAVAIADSFSDALGVHISEEAVEKSAKKVWATTLSTFLFKVVFSSVFIIPVVFLDLKIAVLFGIVIGMALLISLSYFIAKDNKEIPIKVISEHVLIAILVILITYYVGKVIPLVF
jgi:VIT1/CCC1 family predicted Fe2+/Mn2+ transporter